MKKLSTFLILPALFLGACTVQPTTDGTSSSSSSSAAAMMEARSSMPAMMRSSVATSAASSAMAISSEAASSVATVSSAAASSEQAVQARVIVVSADNFSFNPSTINAKKGEKVILRIKGVAGIHGFGIPDLGVNVRVDAGGSVDVELPTDTAGSFAFRCTIPCGGGHKSMVGTIVIS